MVSLRIDVDLWERLGEAVEQGILPSREQAINEWVREKLESLP
jgi:metal-responsive CopG/Arc/MetJ family transcriptional regulator